MSEFTPAMDCLIRHEVVAYGTPNQRSWSDHAADKGGETNWGWSMLNIRRMGLTPREIGIDQDTFTPGCLKKMPESAARKLYKIHYWDPYWYRKIDDQNVATKLFDFAVNANPRQAVLLVQRALVAMGKLADSDVDGVFGPKTLGAINKANDSVLLVALVAQQTAYYMRLIAKDPTQEVFRVGWLRRARWIKPD